MIPVRYSGVWHGFKLIMKEEGVKGLYRGFLAYIVAVINFIKYLHTLIKSY